MLTRYFVRIAVVYLLKISRVFWSFIVALALWLDQTPLHPVAFTDEFQNINGGYQRYIPSFSPCLRSIDGQLTLE